MRTRTFAVLVVLWGALSAATWTTLRPLAFDWLTPRLGGLNLHDTAAIATAAAGAFPLLAAALMVLLIYGLAQPVRPENAPPRPKHAPARAATRGATSRSAQATHFSGSKTIRIKPDKTLINSGLRFGLVRVANGKGGATGHGEEIYFKKLNDSGTLVAHIPYDERSGFQFQCFVDHRGTKFERVKHALSTSGYRAVTPKASNDFRVRFLLPDYKTNKSDNGQANIVRPA
jgi:hypothetical protein